MIQCGLSLLAWMPTERYPSEFGTPLLKPSASVGCDIAQNQSFDQICNMESYCMTLRMYLNLKKFNWYQMSSEELLFSKI